MKKREHICPYCCWYDGEGFCKNPNYWNYDSKDKSCHNIIGCRRFVEIDDNEIIK